MPATPTSSALNSGEAIACWRAISPTAGTTSSPYSPPTRGVFKGWYCNVSRPARWLKDEIEWVDLELDVVVRPDGRSAVLDEDEFAALVIAEDERVAARAAVDELLRYAQDRTGPFASAALPDSPGA